MINLSAKYVKIFYAVLIICFTNMCKSSKFHKYVQNSI